MVENKFLKILLNIYDFSLARAHLELVQNILLICYLFHVLGIVFAYSRMRVDSKKAISETFNGNNLLLR